MPKFKSVKHVTRWPKARDGAERVEKFGTLRKVSRNYTCLVPFRWMHRRKNLCQVSRMILSKKWSSFNVHCGLWTQFDTSDVSSLVSLVFALEIVHDFDLVLGKHAIVERIC